MFWVLKLGISLTTTAIYYFEDEIFLNKSRQHKRQSRFEDGNLIIMKSFAKDFQGSSCNLTKIKCIFHSILLPRNIQETQNKGEKIFVGYAKHISRFYSHNKLCIYKRLQKIKTHFGGWYKGRLVTREHHHKK